MAADNGAAWSLHHLKARIVKERDAHLMPEYRPNQRLFWQIDPSSGSGDRTRRKRLRSHTSAYHMMLPAEIIGNIGACSMAYNPNIAVVMGGVCRYWREAVCSRPELWTHLVLGSRRPAEKTDLWRERSRKHLVELSILRSFNHRMHKRVLSHDIEDLAPHLRHLTIDNPVKIRDLGWNLWTEGFCRLETLAITHNPPNISMSEMVRPTWDFCRASSTIREMDLRYVQLDIPGGPKNTPFRQIVTLRAWCTKITPRALLSLPNLESLEMYRAVIHRDDDDDGPIALPRLKKFREQNAGFSGFIMPNLLDLTICAGTRDIDFHLVSFRIDRLKISLSKLTSLDLHGVSLDDTWLVSILADLRQVQFLGLAATKISSTILDYLSVHDGAIVNGDVEDIMCPNLVALAIGFNRLRHSSLLALVNSRLPTDERIEESIEPLYGGMSNRSATWKYQLLPRIGWLSLDGWKMDDETLDLLKTKIAFVSAVDEPEAGALYRVQDERKWDTVVDRKGLPLRTMSV